MRLALLAVLPAAPPAEVPPPVQLRPLVGVDLETVVEPVAPGVSLVWQRQVDGLDAAGQPMPGLDLDVRHTVGLAAQLTPWLSLEVDAGVAQRAVSFARIEDPRLTVSATLAVRLVCGSGWCLSAGGSVSLDGGQQPTWFAGLFLSVTF